ncbi:MAG: hypothetical protein ACJ79K_14035 [Gemmatimonadaceae bacterium]
MSLTKEEGMMRGFTVNAVVALAVSVAIGACAADAARNPTSPSSVSDAGGGAFGAAASCSPDVVAPTIASTSANPNTLWPPNHKFVAAAIATTVSDDCDAAPRCAISSVSSNEPVNGLGDGDTAPDWVVTGASTLLVRAERSGTGTGRVYTIGTTCTDAAGNASTGYATITVPHDQGKGNG